MMMAAPNAAIVLHTIVKQTLRLLYLIPPSRIHLAALNYNSLAILLSVLSTRSCNLVRKEFLLLTLVCVYEVTRVFIILLYLWP